MDAGVMKLTNTSQHIRTGRTDMIAKIILHFSWGSNSYFPVGWVENKILDQDWGFRGGDRKKFLMAKGLSWYIETYTYDEVTESL